jgi:hypothetical protein
VLSWKPHHLTRLRIGRVSVPSKASEEFGIDEESKDANACQSQMMLAMEDREGQARLTMEIHGNPGENENVERKRLRVWFRWHGSCHHGKPADTGDEREF